MPCIHDSDPQSGILTRCTDRLQDHVDPRLLLRCAWQASQHRIRPVGSAILRAEVRVKHGNLKQNSSPRA